VSVNQAKILRFVLSLWICGVWQLAGCGTGGKSFDEQNCGTAKYAADLPGENLVYVNPACSGEGIPDGTLESPYATIEQALSSPAENIAIAEGTYDETVNINRAVNLVGAGVQRTLIAPSGAENGVLVDSAENVTVEGMKVEGSCQTGIRIQNSSAVSLHLLSSNGHDSAQECGGYGIFVIGSTDVDISECTVQWNDSVGIAIHSSTGRIRASQITNNGLGPQSSGIAIVHDSAIEVGGLADFQDGDDFYPGCEVNSNTGAGIYVESASANIEGNTVSQNTHGGIALADCPSANRPTVVDNDVASNVSFGISVFGGSAEISGNDVNLVTNCSEENPCFGHCVAVQPGSTPASDVSISGNTVEACESAGILIHGDSSATITSNIVTGAELGGIWLQDGAIATQLANNFLQDNDLAGLMLVSNASANVVDNQIDTTSWGQHYDFYVTGQMVDMADGIVVTRMSQSAGITLAGNEVLSSKRAGIILDDIGEAQVTIGDGNIVAGNGEAGVALQGGAEDVFEADILENKFQFTAEGVDPNGGAGDLVEGSQFGLASFLEPADVGLCTPPDCNL
jgi:parallel beta-helix repeat protein